MNTLIHEELYRSPQLLQKMAQIDLIVCGAGAIGSNLVDNLTRQGFKKVTVIDMDRIEDHNRHTQIWTSRDTGQLKANILKNHVFNTTGQVITSIAKKLDESNIKKLISTNATIIDSFDNTESRKLLFDFCKSNKIDCLHIGLSQDHGEVIWNEKYRVPNKSNLDVCEYPLARNIAILSMVVATECLINYANNKSKDSFIITLRDFKIMAI
jgi:molybdopterin/thiamine biosynthesis adenylyltransferase